MTDKTNGAAASPVGGVLVGFGKTASAGVGPEAADPPPAAPKARDPRVGIVGLGFHTLTVADLCDEAGLRVEFAVDDREGADGDPCGAAYWMGVRGIPVISTAEFVARAQASSDGLTLLAGQVDCGHDVTVAADPFARAAGWVRRTTGRDSLRHPVALLERVPTGACENRSAVFGFPGSGNVLTQNLVAGLYARRADAPPAATWGMRAGLSEHYFCSVAARLRAATASLEPTLVDFVPHEFGTMMVRVECGPARAAVAFDVPCRRHHGLRTFVTHSRPTRAAVEFFAGVGATRVAVVRHPCETLLSQANKIARPARVMLDHPRFLDRAAALLADWTAHLLANRDRVTVVRYEDLAGRRIDALRRLADALDLSVNDDEAGRLFDRFLNRNLPSSVPAHFFRGGSDKWRGEFEPRDLRRVLARVPAEAFTAFGYAVPTEADLSPVPFAGTPVPAHPRYACQLEAYPLHPISGGYGIGVTATDPELADGLAAALQQPEVLALFAAGGVTRAAHPLTLADAA